ncbi:hypothetical protein D3C77_426350 [compost metagenome]
MSCISFNAAATCSFTPQSNTLSVTINIDTGLSFPRDTPNNKILYTSPPQTITGWNSFRCTTDTSWGVKNNLGATDSSNTFPIGDTGLAWQWIHNGTPAYGSSSTLQAGDLYSFKDQTHSIRLLKIGAIKNNAQIPAGDIGHFKAGTLTIFTMRLSTEVKVVAQSC